MYKSETSNLKWSVTECHLLTNARNTRITQLYTITMTHTQRCNALYYCIVRVMIQRWRIPIAINVIVSIYVNDPHFVYNTEWQHKNRREITTLNHCLRHLCHWINATHTHTHTPTQTHRSFCLSLNTICSINKFIVTPEFVRETYGFDAGIHNVAFTVRISICNINFSDIK